MMGDRILTVIKPIPETIETMLDQVFGRSKIEPGINCETIVRLELNGTKIVIYPPV